MKKIKPIVIKAGKRELNRMSKLFGVKFISSKETIFPSGATQTETWFENPDYKKNK